MAPYGRMLRAMLGELAVPTCERPDASQPGPLPFSWDRAAQVAMETGGLWLLHGGEKKGWEGRMMRMMKERGREAGGEGSRLIESNKSDRSQRSELAAGLSFDVG